MIRFFIHDIEVEIQTESIARQFYTEFQLSLNYRSYLLAEKLFKILTGMNLDNNISGEIVILISIM